MPADRMCPACGGTMARWRSVTSAEPALAGQRFTLVRCPACGTATTVEPAPPDVHETGAYGGGRPRLAGLARPILNAFDRRRLALLREIAPPPARLIDAGAGRGRFVVAARNAGYSALGVEPSGRGAEAACRAGAPVIRTSIEEADIEAGSADVVSLWHVLEHLEDPGPALERVHDWLRPRGGVLVGIPNLGSFQARAGGDRWYHLDVPRHRVHFTLPGAGALLERHGFRVIRTEHRLLEHNPYGLWQSLVSRLTEQPSYLYNLLKRNAPAASLDLAISVAALPAVPAAVLAELLAAMVGRGGTVAVLARRAE